MELRPINQPRLNDSKRISFGHRFSRSPDVFVALNSIDIDCKANLWINAYVDGVSGWFVLQEYKALDKAESRSKCL